MTRITIPLPPVTKKNSQRICINSKGKPFIMPSKQYKEYEQAAGWFIPRLNIDYPVNVKCLFYMPTQRNVDSLNLLGAVDDILVKYGCVVDDNSKVIVAHDGSRVLYDKDNPRTEITITEARQEGCVWECCNEDKNVYMCQRCGNTMLLLEGNPYDNFFEYCPYCGASMGRSKEE